MGGSNKKDKLKFTVRYTLNGPRSYINGNGDLVPAKMVSVTLQQLENPGPNLMVLYPPAPLTFVGVGTTPDEALSMAKSDAKAYVSIKDNMPEPDVVEI